MTKVTVEYEVDISKVGRGFFENRVKDTFGIVDEYIQVKKINGPAGWK